MERLKTTRRFYVIADRRPESGDTVTPRGRYQPATVLRWDRSGRIVCERGGETFEVWPDEIEVIEWDEGAFAPTARRRALEAAHGRITAASRPS